MTPVARISRVRVGVDVDAAWALNVAGALASAWHAATVQMLKECVDPVLFVPSGDGKFERSSP